MSSWTKELDEATVMATKQGYWHIVLFYLLCFLASIPTSFLVFSQVFLNAVPEHWCAAPPELQVLGLSELELRELTVPEGPLNGTFHNCLQYDVDPHALYAALKEYVDERSEMIREGGALRLVKTRQLYTVTSEPEKTEQLHRIREAILNLRSTTPTPCSHGWVFETHTYTKTLVTDFELVCEKEWMPRTSNLVFWIGSIVGNLFFGWMSDKYGRRPTILLMIFTEVPISVATAFPPDYLTYTVLRAIVGVYFPAMYQLPFILALELMPPDRRTHTGIIVGMLFASGMCLLALLAYFVRDWYALSLVTTLPFILLFSYFWLVPESPRWLAGRGRVREAEGVLRGVARRNKLTLPAGTLAELHKKVKEEEFNDFKIDAPIICNINGHVVTQNQDIPLQDTQNVERKLNNMLSFKPDLNKIVETDEQKTPELEKNIALEVAELVNKKSNKLLEEEKEEILMDRPETVQKCTQTEASVKESLRRKSIQIMTKLLNKEDDSEEDNTIDDNNSVGDCEASLLDLFRYPNLRKKFLIMTFDWVVLGVVYNSMSYNTSNLGVDDYLSFFAGGAVEIPSYIVSWRLMERWGRRGVLSSLMGLGGLACLACVLVPVGLPWVLVGLSLVGRLCAAGAFSVFYVVTGELLPTVLRARTMGASSVIAGLGLLACPYIVHLAVYGRALPLSIMGVLNIAGGATVLLLPETLNQPLPQTVQDGENYPQRNKARPQAH